MSVIYVHLYFFCGQKRTLDQKNGLFGQKTDHFCALKSEMVRLRTKVRKKRTSWQHCAYLLADPVGPCYGLQIVLRVEIRVKDDDTIGRLEINAETSRFGGEEKAKVDRISVLYKDNGG